MKRTTLHRAASLGFAALTVVGLRWLDAEPGLVVAAGLSVLVLGLVMGRTVRDHPVYTSATGDWRDQKWSAAGQVFVVVVAFQAVFSVPVSLADQIGLHVVVLVTFMVGYFLGGLDALERTTDRDGRSERAPADD